MTARFVYDALGRRIGKWSERRSANASRGITKTTTETLQGWDGNTHGRNNSQKVINGTKRIGLRAFESATPRHGNNDIWRSISENSGIY